MHDVRKSFIRCTCLEKTKITYKHNGRSCNNSLQEIGEFISKQYNFFLSGFSFMTIEESQTAG